MENANSNFNYGFSKLLILSN